MSNPDPDEVVEAVALATEASAKLLRVLRAMNVRRMAPAAVLAACEAGGLGDKLCDMVEANQNLDRRAETLVREITEHQKRIIGSN